MGTNVSTILLKKSLLLTHTVQQVGSYISRIRQYEIFVTMTRILTVALGVRIVMRSLY